MVFGREPVLPKDVHMSGKPNPTEVISPQEYVNDVKLRLKYTMPVVRRHIELNQEKMKNSYDRNTRVNIYKEGDQVWLRKKAYKTGEYKKLSPRRTGPWTVLKKLNNGSNYQIQLNGSKDVKVVHHDRISP